MKKEELQNYPKLAAAELEEALETAVSQTRFSMSRFGTGFKHIFSTNHFYTEAPNNQWTNGFWTGQLWRSRDETDGACADPILSVPHRSSD